MVCGFLAHDGPLLAYQLVCGFFRKNGYFKQYLIQPDLVYPPTSLINRATKQILFGHLVTQWIFLYFFYDFFQSRGFASISSPINWCELLYFFPFMILCDTFLYWSHRSLHSPFLYVRFHKQHHEFHSNVPLASEYFSFLEEIFTGFIPTLLGPLIFRPHTAIVFLWIAFRVCESADAHSGYDFPFSIFKLGRPGDRHDFHHSHNKGNFSAFFCFWDSVCGTDEAYNNYKKSQKLSNKNKG